MFRALRGRRFGAVLDVARRAKTDAGVRSALWLGLLLTAVLAVAALISFRIYRQLDAAADAESALVSIQYEVDELFALQLSEETGVRGYLATGRSEFLEPYLASGDRFHVAVARLEREVQARNFSELLPSVAQLRNLHTLWERDVARPLVAQPHGRRALTRLTLGKVYVDQVRGVVDRAHALLRVRLGTVQLQLRNHINDALFGGLATIVIFGSVAGVFLAARLRMLRRIDREREIVETLEGAFRTDLDVLPGSRIGAACLSATQDAAVGGDLYDVLRLDDRRGLVLVADVSGKGLEAAVNTAFVKYSLRTLAFVEGDPGRMLARFNQIFLETVDDPTRFVVLFVGIVELGASRLSYASAGHAAAFLRRGSEVRKLDVTGPIVGADASASYETRQMHLLRGDLLVLATDGLTEARDADGRQLDDDGAMELLREAPGDPQRCADELVRAVRIRSGGRPKDDLALLVIAIDPDVAGAKPRSSEAA